MKVAQCWHAKFPSSPASWDAPTVRVIWGISCCDSQLIIIIAKLANWYSCCFSLLIHNFINPSACWLTQGICAFALPPFWKCRHLAVATSRLLPNGIINMCAMSSIYLSIYISIVTHCILLIVCVCVCFSCCFVSQLQARIAKCNQFSISPPPTPTPSPFDWKA